jgi:hypothetical protein
VGSFYTNITLRTTQPTNVVDALRAAGREAYVSQPQNGGIVVYDRESEEQEHRKPERARKLAVREAPVSALAVLNHDDDALMCTLHENGKLVDEYNSAPGYFDTGDFGSPEGGGEGFVFAVERHSELVTALGLPALAVGAGYNYIDEAEFPEGATEATFTRVG